MLPPLALPAAFFLSGAAGLIFQVVWLYRCGLVLGTSVAAVTVVLSGFMAGLAAGNAAAALASSKLRRPLIAYASLELIVGVIGVAVTYLLPHASIVLTPIARSTGGSGLVVDIARFAVAFTILALPATAMGATLPVLVGGMCATGDRYGAVLGRLYGWNTLGGVAGVIVCEVRLIASVGIAGSAWIAAGLNVCAALTALAVSASVRASSGAGTDADAAARISRRRALQDSAFSTPSSGAYPRWPLLAAATLSGALLLALEVVWFRFLSMYVLITTLATSLMLAVVLAGIGLGGLVASVWLRRSEHASASLPLVACLSGLAVVASYAAFQAFTAGTQAGEWRTVLWFTSVLALPVSSLSGVLFTLIGDSLHADDARASASASAGWLTLANTVGALCGPPLAMYVLLPVAGMERTLFITAAAYGVVAWLGLLGTRHAAVRRRFSIRFAGAGALVVALALFPFGSMSSRYFVRAASAYSGDGATIVASREGVSETLFVMQQQWLGQPVYSRLVTNGFSMSGTALQGQRYMRAFAYYPMLLHDGPLRRALVICYGVGVTVGAVTHIPSVERIDVAEISRDIVSMSDAIYAADARPLNDPRVRLHVEDGRFFLQATNERFDLITGEPPPPRTPGTVNIYTREYFQLMKDRLADGGLATYWVPVARPHPGTDVNTIVRAFCDVFDDCTLWNATPFDLMLAGSRGLKGPRSFEQFAAPWQTPGLESRLREVGFERAEQIGATFLGDAAYLRELTASTPPLTDDFPQRLRPRRGRPSLSDPGYGADPDVTRMYQAVLDVNRARSAFAASPFIREIWPPALIERTLPFFDTQAVLNRVYWDGGRPLTQIEDLDRVLTETTLRTLPLWILGSDEVKQRIGETSVSRDGSLEYSRALRALSGRDFAGAAEWMAAAERYGMTGPVVRPLLAYALTKSGHDEAARAISAAATPSTADERHFWEWLRGRLAGG